MSQPNCNAIFAGYAGIRGAAEVAGRPAPQIAAAGLPIALVDDVEGTRAKIAQDYDGYETLPTYRAMLDREGVTGCEDVAILGYLPFPCKIVQ